MKCMQQQSGLFMHACFGTSCILSAQYQIPKQWPESICKLGQNGSSATSQQAQMQEVVCRDLVACVETAEGTCALLLCGHHCIFLVCLSNTGALESAAGITTYQNKVVQPCVHTDIRSQVQQAWHCYAQNVKRYCKDSQFFQTQIL